MTELPLEGDQQPEFQAGRSPLRAARRGPRGGTREPTRDPPRNGEWRGRDGEVLTRGRTDVSDPFGIPDYLKEPDWDYQWNTVAVVGNNEVALPIDNMMWDNGWRPVNADRQGFAKRFGTPKSGNAIIVGGLRLDERPKSMSDAAKDDEYRRARGQVIERNAALTGGKAALRQALEQNDIPMAGGYPKHGARDALRMSIDPGLDAPKPQYEYE
jgi:hypothetical protein